MTQRIRYISALLLTAVLGWLPREARPDAATYVSQRRPVRAGIVVCSALNMGNYGPENPDPHVFYVLDSRTDLKPLGMEFLNPLAPPAVTAGIYQRWLRRNRGPDPAFVAGTPMSQAFQVGSRITKNMGAYWEVDLDNASTESLQQYDLLYIHGHRPSVDFTPEQRDKLRRFVEGGGTLWVETCGGLSFAPRSPFLFDVQFHNGGGGAGSGTPGAVIAAANHPLLTSPFVLTPPEVQSLGDKGVGTWYLFNPYDPADPAYYDATAGQDSLNPPGRETLVPVVWNTRGFAAASQFVPGPGWRPYVLAGQVGAGRLVFSAQDTGCAINDYVGGPDGGYGGNSGAISGDALAAAKPADLKLVYNLAAWATANRTANVDVHRSGGTSEQIAPVLDEKWEARQLGDAPVGGAAFFKGCVYVVGGDLVLRCFDVRPEEDLDSDGSPDDGAIGTDGVQGNGLPDYIAGRAYDEVWQFDLKQASGGATGASTPTVVEFYDPSFTGSSNGLLNDPQRELVVVTLSDGTVVACRAFPRRLDPATGRPVIAGCKAGENVDWTIPASATGAQDYVLDEGLLVPAPAWSEGVLFVGLNTASGGRIAAIDPRRGGSAFHLTRPLGPGEALVPDVPTGMGAVWSSPTVGYVRDDATGALDKVIYVYVAPDGGQAASMRAIPFGTKGEPLTHATATTFRSRASGATGAKPPWYIFDTGTGAGDNPLLRQRVYCTYTDSATGAVGTRELAYTSAAAPSDNQFTCRYENNEPRVVIGPSVDITVTAPNGATSPVSVAPNAQDVTVTADYTLDWAVATGGPTARVNARAVVPAPDPASTRNRFAGAPALGPDGTLFFSAYTGGAAGSGTGALFAAREQGVGRTTVRWTYVLHDGFAMTVNGQPVSVPARLLVKVGSNATQYADVTGVRFVGSPALRNGVVYAAAKGAVGGQPAGLLLAFRSDPQLILRLDQAIDPGVRVRVKQPNLFTDQPNAWIELAPNQFTVENASGLIRIHSMAPPGAVATNFVSGSLPFVVQVGALPEQVIYGTRVEADGTRRSGPDGIDNLLWYAVLPGEASSSPVVQGTTVWVGLADGRIASYDADPTTSDPQFQANGSQLLRGALWSAQVGPKSVVAPPAGRDNVLAVATADGAFTFEDNRTLIADSRRLLEVNAAGEAVWAADGTRAYAVVGGALTDFTAPQSPVVGSGLPAVQKVAFSRPSVARRIGANGILVVDTGNNRVVQIDRGGFVQWEVSRLQDTWKGLLRPGDPLSLNEPTDCSYWTDFQPDLSVFSSGRYTLPAVQGYIIHYLIADSGNFRVIELVDMYDVNGRPLMTREVNFVSSTLARQGKRYRYRSVQRLVLQNADLPAGWQAPGAGLRYLTLATVQNARMVDPSIPAGARTATGETAETSGGSIALLAESGDPLAVLSNLMFATSAGRALQPIVNPTFLSSFQEIEGSRPVLKFLLADANGCYQARLDFVVHAGQPGYREPVLRVEWLLSADDYYWMTGKRLIAGSIRRLAASAENTAMQSLRQFLIANRFTGQDNPSVFGVPYNTSGNPANGNISGPGEFHGEVFVVKPKTFDISAPYHGYLPDYVTSGAFLLPNPNASIARRVPEEQVPAPNLAVGPIRRSVGDRGRGTSTSILEQPAYADRPF
ncbi:MAG: DUF4159 domain-containing protein [Chthonomonadales bacterium]|nr:DUF4159 domain-containing protein [Chthonomonadales bacterium]